MAVQQPMLEVGSLVPLPIELCPCHMVVSMMRHKKDRHKERNEYQ